MKKNFVRISISLPNKDADRIFRLSHKLRMKQSEFIRFAVDYYWRNNK